ncbi:MAG: IS110 family transposase [Verrucomicrobiia bacterium]|jgi:transposase
MNNLTETTSSVYTGLDIAKATLQLHLQGQQLSLPNTAAGHRQLIKRLRSVPGAHVLCEATGGYERAVVAALHAAQIPVSVLNPAQVRYFALAQGQRAKNDPIDASVLSAYGAALRPDPTPLPDACLRQLRALVQWRLHLLEQLQAARNHAEHATEAFVRKQLTQLIGQLSRRIEAAEIELAAALARSPQWQAQINKLTALDGIGTLTAVSVLCQMPELGQLNRGQTAALGGLAPWTRQSGPWQGQRHIGGGRAAVRRALYMAAVSVARMAQSRLGRFYRRLREAGKPAKVALAAVMRKLLIQMNHALKPA